MRIIAEKDDIVILASGDSCFFGITEFLKTKGVKIDRILPGISSMQYFMNKIRKQWNNVRFYSFHGRVFDFSKLQYKKQFCILTDKTNTPDFISKELKKENMYGKLYVGYNLSYADELIEEYCISDNIDEKSPVNIVFAEIV